MEYSEAVRIVQSLANGIDPLTGEALPDSSPYNEPKVIRVLFESLRALEKVGQQDGRQRGLPDNAGRPWSADEERSLVDAFDRGAPVRQMAAEHGRTEGAITSRLIRLGRLSDRSEVLTSRCDRR